MREPSIDRRDVLERAAELAAAGATAGFAGCVADTARPETVTAAGSETPADGETPTATESPTATPAFEYTDWLPAPSVVIERDHYPFGVLQPSALAPHAGALGQGYYERLVTEDELEQAGIDPANVGTHVAFRAGSAFDASFDADAVVGRLRDAGFERTGSREGFDVLAPTDDGDRAFGVGDGVLVVGRQRGETSPMAALAAVVDAGVGAADRYVAARDPAGELADRLADGQVRIGTTREPPSETDAERGQIAGNTALGYGLAVDGGETTLRYVLVFESAADADAGAVQQWVDNAGGVVNELEDRTVTADGPAVVVSGTMDTGAVSETTLADFFVDRRTEQPIQAGASVAVEGTTVTVTWTSNQNAEYLTATFAPEGGDGVKKRLDEVGDSVTYEGSEGESVHVTVVGHVDDKSAVIFARTVEL